MMRWMPKAPKLQLRRGAADHKKHLTSPSVELQRLGIENIPGQESARVVHLNPPEGAVKRTHASNAVHTAKYNVVTFVPRFLFEQFSQIAYFYFLVQACLVYWSVVSPFKPFGPTLALVFVLLVGALKAIAEDKRRHVEDNKLNNSTAHVLNEDGSTTDIKWSNVKVGQVLKVLSDEDIPADLLTLYCRLDDNVCYIKTTNLDGESNLKVRRPLNIKGRVPENPEAVARMSVTLACEPPNNNLHYFVGRAVVQDGPHRETVSVSMNEILLRGCTLKNSGFVVGLVVYTGPESRIQMNAAEPPRKQGSFTRFLNLQVLIIILLQMLLCAACAGAALAWREGPGKDRYYLALTFNNQGNYGSNVAFFFVNMITFWLLFSYLVPISLFVTIEVVKFILGNFINNDPQMVPPGTKDWGKARNTNIIEDLGRVAYVFSDKTGTLTSNEMRLRAVSIKGVPYGSLDFRLEDYEGTGREALTAFDARLDKAAAVLRQSGFWDQTLLRGGSSQNLLALARTESNTPPESLGLRSPGGTPQGISTKQILLGHHVLDFWSAICICHNLIVEGDAADGAFRYQGPSPDEVALVEGARQLGFEFRGRTRSHLTVSFQGREVTHEILVELEFTSDRARMSVVARAPDGTIRLLTKGSDAVMMPRLRAGTDATLLQSTEDNLHAFSVKGLRTLIVGSKVLSEDVWQRWHATYTQAASSLDERESRIAAVAEQLETDLELLGVTAIEDKLQEGVPEAISTLIDAGMRVWMITGDKQETAINIGISAGLISDASRCLVCNAGDVDSAAKRLGELHARLMREHGAGPSAPSTAPSVAPSVADSANSKHAQNGKYASSVDTSPEYLMPPGGLTSSVAGGTRSGKQLSSRPELVVDGRTLGFLFGTPAEKQLAAVAAGCASVIVCRASPSQKAAVVRMMMEFEVDTAQAGKRGKFARWLARYKRRMDFKMLAIGDGANDVAMIQTADIGVGVMGKEGRQAVNNSDYAVGQFRFLVRLLLVHGSLSVYRLARLIKYSFYKNVTLAFLLFMLQPFGGWSGQAMLDGITASFINAFFTAFPIGLFAIVDRPFRDLKTYMRFPKLYNLNNPLRSRSYWKTGIIMGIVHGITIFLIVYYTAVASGRDSVTDIYSTGKSMFLAMIMVVTCEIGLLARYWTKPFIIICLLSYILVYPFIFLVPLIERGFGSYDVTLLGVGVTLMAQPLFWLQQVALLGLLFGSRFVDRSMRTMFYSNDYVIVAEAENRAPKDAGLGEKSVARLEALSVSAPLDHGGGRNGSVAPAPTMQQQQAHQNGQLQLQPQGQKGVRMAPPGEVRAPVPHAPGADGRV